MYPEDLRFTEDHEWVRLDGEVATVGISSYAVEELGEIVFVELPAIGSEIQQMAEFGSVESVKTVSSLYLPVGGVISEINDEVVASPETINNSPFEDGWLVKIRISDDKEIDDLMTAEEYTKFIQSIE